jgi:hypothetical protein
LEPYNNIEYAEDFMAIIIYTTMFREQLNLVICGKKNLEDYF